MVIRKHHRTYNGLFQRRIRIKNFRREITDKIVIYNKTEEFEIPFLDNVLVHEMIHQYIIQNDIKDTRTHGKVFREFMARINAAFPEELKISIRDRNPGIPMEGKGDKIHKLLFLSLKDGNCFCAVIMPGRESYFEKLIKSNKKNWNVKRYHWAESDNVFFNQFSRCKTSFHGIKKPLAEMIEFCQRYNIRN